MYLVTTKISIFLGFTVGLIYCSLQAIPEKVDIYYTHPDHIENFTLKVRRYGRQSPYYVVGQGTLKHTWNNNVTMFLETYEYLHNEYRLSFMNMRVKVCDLINKDKLVGLVLRKNGFTCPVYAGEVVFPNISMYWNDFPYEFPIMKGLGNFTLRNTATNELLLGVRLFASIKQKRKMT